MQEAETRVNELGWEPCLFLQVAKDIQLPEEMETLGTALPPGTFITAASQPLSTRWACRPAEAFVWTSAGP